MADLGYDPDADTFEYLKTVVRAIHDIVARREQASPASPS